MRHRPFLQLLAFVFVVAWGNACFHCTAEAKDFVVDAKGGDGTYKTVQAAINAVPAGTANERTRILIKPGTYSEQLRVPDKKVFLSLIGTGAKPEDVVLTFNLTAKSTKPGGGVVGTSDSSSTFINASDFTAENLTFSNSAPPKIAQAVAIKPQADKLAFYRCRFLGFQDTLYPCRARQYYKECYVTGTVDFIFGDATAVFDHCTINSSDKGYITAASTGQNVPHGLIFLDCTLTATDNAAKQPNTVFLGRPWRPYAQAAYIRCKMGPHIRAVGWDNWNNAANEKTARYVEFGSMDLTGKLLDVSQRVKWSKQLTADQAKEYTIENVLSGKDRWEPAAGFTTAKK
ncbi:MAG TPA: pectinesterase family protein [Gemmataceae bacterium]|nr:pectinesterase family protein [Gemmataceae bacterium]